MGEKIFIGVAWPYASGPRHLGHVAGAYLPADIFARYHRMVGNRVLMVSGSDEHGTPITIAAEKEGISPRELVARNHRLIAESFQKLGISFDLYTETTTENHYRIVQEIFLRLLERGYLFKDTMISPYCPVDRRFLPDRYVEGTCPVCGYGNARGDQCDNCGTPLDPTNLVKPRCRLCGNPPEFRPTEHFFFDLPQFEEPLRRWLADKSYWRPNVLNFTLNWLREGLKPRAITRDIEWGIPVPVPGFEDKRIYVWFDAVIGYYSASVEWAQRKGDPDAWKEWWVLGPEGEAPSKAYYFIGKDNIPFHTIIWPAILMGYGGLNLPYDVPANEYLTMEGEKLSTSRGYAIWLPDFLERYDPDPLRYYLSANMPETKDTNFSWSDFVRRNNDELVATWGNLAHRVLTFTHRSFEGRVPEPGDLSARDRELLERVDGAFDTVGSLISRCHFRDGIREIMAVAQEANRYLEETSPWKSMRTQRQEAARALYTALQAIGSVNILMAPYLPFSSAKLHRMLGFDNDVHSQPWKPLKVPSGQALGQPEALFKKLDESVVEYELSRA
jgi:methionyl-tRNA synthetase